MLLLGAGLAFVEALTLQAFGQESSVALAPHVSAPPPFGLFHDLRFLLVFHRHWWEFGLELLGVVVFRTLIVAGAAFLAWPETLDRPRPTELLRRAAAGVGVGLVVLTPAVVLLFGASAVSLSWLLLAGVPNLVVAAVLTHHVGIAPDPMWRLPRWETVGWTLLEFILLSLAAAAVVLGPSWLWPVTAAVAGWGNAWVWRRIVANLAPSAPRGRVPWTPVLVISYAALILVGLVLLGAGVGPGPGLGSGSPPAAQRSGRSPVLLALGFNSSWDGRAQLDLGADLLVWRYSYRGLDPNDRPLSYSKADTHQSLRVLSDDMAAEVGALSAATGRRVALVASSEGTVVARTFLGRYPDAPVGRVVFLSPLARPATVYYPVPGQDGWGLAAGWGLRGLIAVVGRFFDNPLNADMPFLRSIVDHAPALRDGMLCAIRGEDEVGFTPIAGVSFAPVDPPVPQLRMQVVNGFHGAAVRPEEIAPILADLIGRDSLPREPAWAPFTTALRAAAAAWHMPELPMRLNPGWRPLPPGSGCAAATSAFLHWSPLSASASG